MLDSQDDRMQNGRNERERRTGRRFTIDQEVKYKMLYGQRIAETASAHHEHLQRRRLFITENMLTSGMLVELSRLACLAQTFLPHKLMIYGCVVRSNEKGAAVVLSI